MYSLPRVTIAKQPITTSVPTHVLVALLLGIFVSLPVASTETDNNVVLMATHPEKSEDPRSFRQRGYELNRLLQCIFDRIGLDYDVYYMPWARAKRELSRSTIDGIFLTTSNENISGIKTKPIYLEKWFALSRMDKVSSLSEHRIGVIRDSDIAHWLRENGISAHINANNYKQLIDQFQANRFDLFIADINLLKRVDNAAQFIDTLNRQFVQYRAKGVTFSQDFIRAHPSLISEFNANIDACRPATTKLNTDESNIIKQFIHEHTRGQWPASFLSQAAAFAAETQQLSENQIQARDIEWRDAVAQASPTHFMRALMRNPISTHLRKITAGTTGISEIFLTDVNGVLLGSSMLLSDYFQGDEEKVLSLTGQNWALSDINYDASSGHFVSHYSARLHTPQGNTLILIIGVNLEDIMRGEGLKPVVNTTTD